MALDVATVLALHEQDERATQVPMHGQPGQVRRNPSTDQKKVRRSMTTQKQATADGDQAVEPTIPELLRQAAKAPTEAEQQALMLQVEQRTTQRLANYDAGRSLDLSIKEAVEVIPRGTHEMHTGQTDWLLSEGMHVTSSMRDSEHALIAEATHWFARCPDYVKEDQEEFRVQAFNLARRTASQYGDNAEAAAQAFIGEAERLYALGAKTGAFQIKTAAMIHDLDNGGMVDDGQPDPSMTPGEPKSAPNHGRPGKPLDTSLPDSHDHASDTPGIEGEIGKLKSGQDAAGVGDMARGYAQQELRAASLQRTASLAETDAADLTTLLAGGDPGAHTAASSVPQVGLPAAEFGTGAVVPYPDAQTDSNRAPAIQEIQGYTGWDGSSVVPGGDPGAAGMNNDSDPTRDFAGTQQTHAARMAAQLTKESSMTDYAACPHCGGQGRVAVRKQAYSGLPQVDQIVNADETQGATPLPPDVAFPLTGWGQTPEQGPQNVQRTIQQAEGQIAERNAKSPLASTGSYVQGYDQYGRPASHIANGRDNSGWMGDMGAKGTDYPGYSTPQYDGSSNLGQPDPVYQFGGDQGNRPLLPYGEEEANDVTNNPPEGYDPSAPHDNAQAYRSVSPGMSTSGSFHPDPVIAQAQQQIIAAQQAIAARNAQYAAQR